MKEKLVKMAAKKQCDGTMCPAGCCPEQNWFCCPDNMYCAATAAPSIEAFLCGFVNNFSISCMCPLLLTALSMAHRHLHLLQPLGEGGGHRSAVVLTPKLILTGEREELRRSHKIMTSILTKVIRVLVIILKII